MRYSTCIALAALLGCTPLNADPQAAELAADRIIHAVLPPAKQRELFNAAADRMTDKLAQKGLPPAVIAELQTALRDFMGQLVSEGVFAKAAAAQFREKLTDDEMLTLATFLESSVGQKLVSKTISLKMDKEAFGRDLKNVLDAKKAEFTAVMNQILVKHGIKTR